MRRTRLFLLAALQACDDRGDSGESPEMVPLPRRADRVGDRYEVELRSRSTRVGDDGTADSRAATLRYTDEVLAVGDGRATLVRRSYAAGEGGEPGVVELDVRAGKGSGRGGRTDHFRQFERLLPSSCAPLGVEFREDGALGAPPSSVLGVSDAAWLDSRCACTLVRVAVLDGRRVAEFKVRITFEEGGGPSRLDGSLQFDLEEGMLREVALRGSAGGRSYELHGIQRVLPAAPR